MSDLKENIVVVILKYWPVKYLIVALLALVVWSGVYHFYRCHLGLNSKFFWSECLECKVVTIDLITKHDTTKSYFDYPDGRIVKIPIHKTHKKSIAQVNTQKIDSGGSGLENNAPNLGQQAGHDINNYGIIPRDASETELAVFLLEFPDKKTHIAVNFIGMPDGEMIKVKEKIINTLRRNGYDNVGSKSGFSIPAEYPKNISYEKQSDGSVLFMVPPAQ